ncbi:MAG: hypothetical protein COA79_01075 [Planctomycetota bacterium]|nr:MAG: hypothetical protein COA79_01075 [Planctomycetota bacterium]
MGRFAQLFQEVSIFFNKMSSTQKLTLGMFVFTVTIILASITSSVFVDKKEVLFTGLSSEEQSNILSKLESYGVEKELKNNIISVNAGEKDSIIMRLSMDKALPDKGTWGFFELLKNGNSWSDTSESKRQKYLVALSNEVKRIISSLDNIASAEVIISKKPVSRIYRPEAWEQRTATVKVKVKSGKHLTHQQAEGIAEIVAGSAEDLSSNNVTVVDGSGKSYKIGNGEDGFEGNMSKFKQVKNLENEYVVKIKDILEAFARKSLKDIKVAVSITLNLDKVESRKDFLDPDSTVVTLKDTVDTTSITEMGNNEAGANANAGANDNNGSSNKTSAITKKNTIQTKVSTEVTTTKKSPGTIENISVAVTLPYAIGEDKKEIKLTPQEISDASILVLKAVGKPLKIDDIIIQSVPYRGDFYDVKEESKIWHEYVSELIPPGFNPVQIILGFVLFLVVIKLLKITKTPEEIKKDEEEEEVELLARKQQETSDEDRKIIELEENLNKAIGEDVKKAATIIKSWAISG